MNKEISKENFCKRGSVVFLLLGCFFIFLIVSGATFYHYSQKLPPEFYISVKSVRLNRGESQKDISKLKELLAELRTNMTPAEYTYYTDSIKQAEDVQKKVDQLGPAYWQITTTILAGFWKPILIIHIIAIASLITCFLFIRDKLKALACPKG
jgi:predicted PurR-regulated permease PerM